MKEIKIDAVYEEDLVKFLESLELLQPILSGSIKCEYCGDEVSLDNLFTVFVKDNDIKVCCKKLLCSNNLHEES